MHALGRRTVASLAIAAAAVTLALAAKPLPPGSFEGPPKFELANGAMRFDVDLRAKIGPGPPPGNSEPDRVVAGAQLPDRVAPFAWSKIISPSNIEAEIKALQKRAEESTKTINPFLGNGRVLAQQAFAELAVLFGVITQYDGDVRWKKEAASLSEIFAQSELNCRQPGGAALAEAQLRSRQLADLIRGIPLDLPPAEPPRNWATVTNRPALMRRLEEVRTDPKAPHWPAPKNNFKMNKEALLRESEVMRVIAEVIKDANFESGDDDAYQRHAKTFAEQCAALVEAIKDGNPENAQSAMSRVSKSCDACHGDFR